MAAILEKLLEKHISPEQVLNWLQKKSPKECDQEEVLAELAEARGEFLPFFINFLRDQTVHLLQNGRSANNTPAKTPTAFKVKRKSMELGHVQVTSTPAQTHSGKRSSANRVQLFTSPLDAKVSMRSDGSLLESPNTLFEASQISNDSIRRGGSTSRRQNAYKGGTHADGTPRGKNSYIQTTPDSHRSGRQRHNASLGEFLFNTSEQEASWSRKKKSPLSGRRDESSPSPHGSYRKSGSKQKKQQNAPRRQSQGTPQEKAPVFSLNNMMEFPSLGSDAPAGGKAPDSPSNLPEGAKVITSSRRVQTTLVSSQNAESRDNSLFINAALESPQPGSLSYRNRFMPSPQPGSTGFTDERKLLRECKGRRINLDQDPSESESSTPAVAIFPKTPQTPTKTVVLDIPASGSENKPTKLVALTPVKKSSTEPAVTPTKNLLERLSSLMELVQADKGSVSYHEQLTLMADLYSRCIDAHLVPNVTVELYFIMQLLTCRGGGGELEPPPDIGRDADEIHYFSSVHNTVFFAVEVLLRQIRLLQLLDRGLLRMLSDNQRVVNFSPVLKQHLDTMYEKSPSKSGTTASHSPIGGVSFQADTDNVKNFPSEKVFHIFKKQRDMFYELIREWEESHLSPGWSMLEAQTDRIRHLVSYRAELANHIHLARLFQSQLLQMCKGDSSFKSEGDEDNIALLSQLKQTNPAKFKRLQSRFITPSSCGGPCPLPAFQGCQEFFRNFIYAASSNTFNQHLTDSMACKVAELNSTQFSDQSDLQADQEEDRVDVEDRETLANCLLTLRLLGKFLGFVTFLPYQNPEVLPDSMLLSYTAMRNKSGQLVDVLKYLKTAQREGRTLITVPWVVEFLSMMDPLAPQLDYYHHVSLILLSIYRETSTQFQAKASHALLLTVTILGWLFEGFFFSEVPDDIGPSCCPKGCLDSMNLVDQQMLYSCCPYLGEVRSLLVDFAVGMSSRTNTVRKITPVSTQAEVSGTLTEKQLQNHLEENFFHNHPASLKRTVEFVGDRVASNFIKKFRTQTFPSLLEEGHQGARTIAERVTGESLHSRSMGKATQQIQELSTSLTDRARKSTDEETLRYCPSKSGSILPQLLPEDISHHVLQVCIQIASRTALHKIHSWLSTHINANMFKRELTANFEKHLKALNNPHSRCNTADTSQPIKEVQVSNQPIRAQQTPGEPIRKEDGSKHNEDCISPSDAIILLKCVLKGLLLGQTEVTTQSVLAAFTSVQDMLNNRLDVTTPVIKTLSKVVVDLTYTIIFQHPSVWTPELQCHLLRFYTTRLQSSTAFQHILCAKHLHMVKLSSDPQLSWTKLTDLAKALTKVQLLATSEITEACNSLLHANITQESFIDLVDMMCFLANSSPGEDSQGFLETLTAFSEASIHISQSCHEKLEAHIAEIQVHAKEADVARMKNSVQPGEDSDQCSLSARVADSAEALVSVPSDITSQSNDKDCSGSVMPKCSEETVGPQGLVMHTLPNASVGESDRTANNNNANKTTLSDFANLQKEDKILNTAS